MIFQLKEAKQIDGYIDSTHFEVIYVLDENTVVGNYGIAQDEDTFQYVYSNATCPKTDLVNYTEEVVS